MKSHLPVVTEKWSQKSLFEKWKKQVINWQQTEAEKYIFSLVQPLHVCMRGESAIPQTEEHENMALNRFLQACCNLEQNRLLLSWWNAEFVKLISKSQPPSSGNTEMGGKLAELCIILTWDSFKEYFITKVKVTRENLRPWTVSTQLTDY